MPALIGYLMTIAVFLGGGYAGMQWLTAPEDLPSAVAVHRSVEPMRSTRARLLARKKHEAAAEREADAGSVATPLAPAPHEAVPRTAESDAATAQPEAMTARAEPAQADKPAQHAAIPQSPVQQSPTVVDAHTDLAPAASASPQTPQNTAASPMKSMPSDVHSAARTAAIAGAAAAIPAAISAKPDREPKALEKKARPVVARDDDPATESRRGSVTKRRAATRLASRKPILMILRTIEYPDGRREQRLLPMPRYRQAFADD